MNLKFSEREESVKIHPKGEKKIQSKFVQKRKFVRSFRKEKKLSKEVVNTIKAIILTRKVFFGLFLGFERKKKLN